MQVPDIMGRAVLKPWVFRRDILREGSFLGLWVARSQCLQHSHAAVVAGLFQEVRLDPGLRKEPSVPVKCPLTRQ